VEFVCFLDDLNRGGRWLMAIIKSEKMESEAIEAGAAMMALAMRTAPKTRGIDALQTAVVTGADIEILATAMEKKSEEKSTSLPIFKRDANNVRNAAVVLLVGVKRDPKRMELPFNCGACGYQTCAALVASGSREGEDFIGPVCIFQAIDLGIALGSAVKLAAELGIDNRIMYTVGAAAKDLSLLDSDLIIGIPLSATGKNPFFDRS
jgi:uncharacterized ferredoxin-like protein